MKKIFIKIPLFLIAILLLTGCQNTLKRVGYDEIKDMIDKKETFILEITQDGCSHCEEFTPRLKTILKDNNLEAYNLNISYISESDYNKFNEKYTFEGTPTTMFFNKGKEIFSSRITGSISDKKLKNTLKKLKYIK